MATFYDVPADALLEAAAEDLAERLDPPVWSEYAKSGTHAELAPEQEDFWARRAASLLRRVATDGPVGVERLSTAYGGLDAGSNRYRVAPAHRSDGSKHLIRTLLQQLEEEGLVATAEGEGRVATDEGVSYLDQLAEDVLAELDRPELERYA
ncbi:MAG: 30S ribosomal protein S19e [Salinarchaeum sp.]